MWRTLRALREDAVELTRSALLVEPDAARIGKTVTGNDSYSILALQRVRMGARGRVPGLNHVLRRVQTAVFGIEIGNDVTLGRGVYFVHPIGITIGGDAVVGDRVRFYGNNTIGTAKENGYPVIEEDVVIGAGARILGPVRVGARAQIGANAVVVHDVPADAVAVGIPARVVKTGAVSPLRALG